MAAGRSPSSFSFSWLSVLVFFGIVLAFAKQSAAATRQDTQYVQYTNSDGQNVWLADNRRPALYTQDFGDCMGDSLINVTRFDAAYYKDNMTVLFHLAGNSALTNQSLMRMFSAFVKFHWLKLIHEIFQSTSVSLPTENNVSN